VLDGEARAVASMSGVNGDGGLQLCSNRCSRKINPHTHYAPSPETESTPSGTSDMQGYESWEKLRGGIRCLPKNPLH
jgi:hypothetical protein